MARKGEAAPSASKLFKYRSLRGDSRLHAERLIVQSEAYFASPATFNDPLDCRVPQVGIGGSDDDLREKLKEEFACRQGLRLEDAAARAEDIIRQGVHRQPEALEAMRRDLQKDVDGLGVFCASERPDDPLMWAHYADCHNGFCVEFQHSGSDLLNGAQRVIYSDTRPSTTYLGSREDDSVNVLLTKALCWEYEAEWRRFELDRGPGPYLFPPEEITGVIFGIRMSEGDRSQVLRWVRERPTPTAVSEARLSSDKFQLEIVALA